MSNNGIKTLPTVRALSQKPAATGFNPAQNFPPNALFLLNALLEPNIFVRHGHLISNRG
jgi:hypothetical protein